MKKIALFVLVACLAYACGQKPADPVAEAIVAEMMKDIDQPYEIDVTELQKLDSTSFATEFQRRISIYDIRLDQNTARMEKYIREGKTNNATRVFEALQRDTKIFNELNAMKEMMGADTLKTAYYDYSYTYSGKVGGQRIAPKKAFATVTPEGKVITFAAERKELHKATGLVIPGYKELLDSFKETEEEE